MALVTEVYLGSSEDEQGADAQQAVSSERNRLFPVAAITSSMVMRKLPELLLLLQIHTQGRNWEEEGKL